MKLGYLEGIRGIAALIVVIWHYVLYFYPPLANTGDMSFKEFFYYNTHEQILMLAAETPLCLFFHGQASVRLFFVLSAFVLTYKFFRTKNYEYLSAGAIKRYFRLLGPVVFSLFITYILVNLSLVSNVFIATEFSIKEFFKEAFFGVFVNGSSPQNPPLWTMSYEFFGSMLVFSVAALFAKYKRRWIIYLILVLLFHKTHYLAFVFGMMLSDYFTSELYSEYHDKISHPKIIVFLITVSLFLYTISGVRQQIWGSAIFIFCVLHSESLKKFFSHTVFLFLGRISFSMYVMHAVILSSFSYYLNKILIGYINNFLSMIVTLLVSLIIIIPVACFVEKYIDRNSIKLSKKIYEVIVK